MSKSCTERCEQLKSVFQQVESFEFLGVKQTNSADVVVLSWNGSKKFNANQIKIDIQKFIKNSTLKLPDNESWRPVGFPPFEIPSTKNCIVFHPKKRSKKDGDYKPPSKNKKEQLQNTAKSRNSKRKKIIETKNNICICKAKLIEIYREQLTDEYIYCDECNKEIKNKKNVLVYHCVKKSDIHKEGWDICVECVKKKK
eukprot:347914_1